MEPNLEYLKRLKMIELNMLKAFASACEKLDLEWFALGGTLLGAIRHKGFIPWDDDIDIGMKRKNYNIFLNEGQKLLGNGLFLQTPETDPEYCLGFSKIRNSNTTFIESSARKLNINHGVYIDIFPLDYYPEKHFAQRWIEFRKKLLNSYIAQKCFSLVRKPHFRRKVAYFAGCLAFRTVGNAVSARDKLFQSIGKSNLMVNYCGIYGEKEVFPVSYFDHSIEMKFEDFKIKAPVEFDNYLKRIYGNYMELPSLESRSPHHLTVIIDLDKPYTDYTYAYRRTNK